MVGYGQENWLGLRIGSVKAKWNVIAQDVLMAQLREKMPDGNVGFWTDDWDGFPASHAACCSRIARSGCQIRW